MFNTCCADAPDPAKAAITAPNAINPDFIIQPFHFVMRVRKRMDVLLALIKIKTIQPT
jgi:hypothetical protein